MGTAALRIGELNLPSRFLLAPLESVSDCAWRRLCFEQGAGLTFTEMIRARGVELKNASTLDLCDTHHPEVLTGIQLLATQEKELTAALETLERLAGSNRPWLKNLQAVDLNFGCPSPDVIRAGAGPALLKRRSRMRGLFETLAAWKKKTALPIKAVGAKIRLGLHNVEVQQKVYLRVAELANDTLDFLTVHGRHARQGSSEPAQWAPIGEVKARCTIPVIGNGDVFSREAADRLFAETGCDGALIARGAIRSPWIFRELTGRGSGLPTTQELDLEEARYFKDAAALGTRPKYLTWHREGFARLRARLAGQAVGPDLLPENTNL
jgi:tRNA-dihydrouridine synthase